METQWLSSNMWRHLGRKKECLVFCSKQQKQNSALPQTCPIDRLALSRTTYKTECRTGRLSLISSEDSCASLAVLVVKNLLAKTGDARNIGSILGLGRYPGEGMATYSSILAWKIPWEKEAGTLQSIGSQRVGHN